MVVVWRITERCNLGCEFCRYDRTLRWNRRDADPQQVLKFGRLLAQYQQTTGDSVLVCWLGGEPLLWQPLENIARQFKRDLDLNLSITTNGTPLASESLRAHLMENYSELTVSVDGFAVFHDKVRQFQNGFEVLRQTVGLIAEEKRWRGSGPVLRANIVLMRDNLEEFEPLCSELALWGIEEVTFNQLGGNDRPEFYPSHRLLPQQAQWLTAEFPRIRRNLAANGLRLRGGTAYLQRIAASSCDEPVPVRDCRPGESFLFIDEQGRIAPCGFTIDGYGIPLDFVDSVDAFRELPLRFALIRNAGRHVSCDDCHSTQVFEKFA